jgi:hypothetical protein
MALIETTLTDYFLTNLTLRNYTMFKSLIAVAAVSFSVLAANAHAYSLVSTEKVSGVVSSVNIAEKTLSVTTAAGGVTTVIVADSTKIVLEDGSKYSLDAIKVGNNVVLKRQILTQASNEIKGSLVSVDKLNRTVTLRDATSNQLVALQFSENTTFKGAEENTINALKEGQDILIRSAAI